MPNQMGQEKIKTSLQQMEQELSQKKGKNFLSELILTEEALIRIGVSIADEQAREESKKHRLKAPLSTEERIFSMKSNFR
jgi:hypothetical protein